MATQTVKPGKHYQARSTNDFLTISRKDGLAAPSIKKKKLEVWIKKWAGWLTES